MKGLDMLEGAALVSAAIAGYFTLQAGVSFFGAALFLSGLTTGIYVAEYMAKSERTSYGEQSQ